MDLHLAAIITEMNVTIHIVQRRLLKGRSNILLYFSNCILPSLLFRSCMVHSILQHVLLQLGQVIVKWLHTVTLFLTPASCVRSTHKIDTYIYVCVYRLNTNSIYSLPTWYPQFALLRTEIVSHFILVNISESFPKTTHNLEFLPEEGKQTNLVQE